MEIPLGIWQLTPAGFGLGVIALFYWLLATGRLIPLGSHERELKLANERGDEWKETAKAQQEVNAVIRGQNSMLIESNRISDHFYKAMNPNGNGVDEITIPGIRNGG